MTQDARFCGTTASMCGVESALEAGDEEKLRSAVTMDLMLHAYMLTQSGIPMLYSGDEVGQLNDYSYKEDGEKCVDSRYIHRGRFQWELAAKRREKGTLQERIFSGLKALETIRKARSVSTAARQFTPTMSKTSPSLPSSGKMRKSASSPSSILPTRRAPRGWRSRENFRIFSPAKRHGSAI